MEYELVCNDCHLAFIWDTPYKKFCSTCKTKHRLATEIKYNRSSKGKAANERRNLKKRESYKMHYNKFGTYFCQDCKKPLHRRSTRCGPCHLQYLRSLTMEQHPNWKGGIAKEGGYILIRTNGHPRATKKGYVRQHLLVWEEAHRKSLPNGWIIHHLNGIKDDNRPANLVALPNKKHYLVLQAKAKRIQELEAMVNRQGQLL